MAQGSPAHAPVVLPVGFVTVVATVELITREILLLGLLSVGAPLAAVSASAFATAAVGIFALATGVLAGVTTGYGWSGDHLTGLAGILLVGLISVLAADRRVKREAQLSRLTEVARVAQEAILPPVPATVGPLDVAVRYRSAAPEALVGGDLYEVSRTPRSLRAIVGDARGKGLQAVRLASDVMSVFRHAALEEGDLLGVAEAVDRAVNRLSDEEDFVTAVLAEFWDDGHLDLLSCGHPPPVLVREGRLRELEAIAPSPPLGLRSTGGTVDRHRIRHGDRVLFYSDGLTEARDSRGGFFPLLARGAEPLGEPDLERALDRLLGAVNAHAGGPPDDDLALVLVQWRCPG